MNTKEWLSRAYKINKRIEFKREQLMRLSALAERSTASLTAIGNRTNDNRSKVEMGVERLVMLQDQLADDILEMTEAYAEIREAIMALPDQRHRTVLEAYHLNYLTTEQIAERYNYCERQVWRLLEEARRQIVIPQQKG